MHIPSYHPPPPKKNKLESTKEEIFTLFWPQVTNEETKHRENLFVHESRGDLSPSLSKTEGVPKIGDFQWLHWESSRQTGMIWSSRQRQKIESESILKRLLRRHTWLDVHQGLNFPRVQKPLHDRWWGTGKAVLMRTGVTRATLRVRCIWTLSTIPLIKSPFILGWKSYTGLFSLLGNNEILEQENTATITTAKTGKTR